MCEKELLEEFIMFLPKAELHVHIEGTLEPGMMFGFAERNQVALPYQSIGELMSAYKFSNLQDFLNLYYEGARVLVQEEDFYELTHAYLDKAHSQHVLHTEMFFDPQTHTGRGVPFGTVVRGISRAMQDAEKNTGISSKLIMCFRRDLDEDNALSTLNSALPYKELITGVGLDSAEVGNPAAKFIHVFRQARSEGFHCTAHAGEEGPASYVDDALHQLHVSRIDHGIRSIDNEQLAAKLAKRRIPLTVCPLSNLKLKVVSNLRQHPLKNMLGRGMMVTVNSDDPAYFGGYVNENLLEIALALDLNLQDIYTLAKNSFLASFISEQEKRSYLMKLDAYYRTFARKNNPR